METYQQVHDFTAEGAARFAEFVAEHGAADVSPDTLRLSCLGVIEDNLNGAGLPLVWELSAANSRDGIAHTFMAELDDIIIETIEPEHDAAGLEQDR
ncbi:hypothetical protein LXM94_25480 [Rhizobium sp. TRM95111]|uniref:hypothetical protein n=1 Tax=Rhizobium alarense TaxID=2846851 RepID=UPI001F3BBBE6|nr:hypothetical protein [Rhizobium alarense]MCF3643309.1 hypothetical protein [Rhizobium alarense]